MTDTLILNPDKHYTFYDYFKMKQPTDRIFAAFGYGYVRQKLALAQADDALPGLDELRQRLEKNLQRVSLTNETARREFLIAPLLSTFLDYTNIKLRVEEPVYVNKHLQGNLDYYLENHNQLLVIEAKNADLQRGFTQLGVELIALDQKIEPAQTALLYGAVSIGDIWQFGTLQRETKQITHDIELYRVPTDLEALFRILIALFK